MATVHSSISKLGHTGILAACPPLNQEPETKDRFVFPVSYNAATVSQVFSDLGVTWNCPAWGISRWELQSFLQTRDSKERVKFAQCVGFIIFPLYSRAVVVLFFFFLAPQTCWESGKSYVLPLKLAHKVCSSEVSPDCVPQIKKLSFRTSLAIQWLGLWASTAGGTSLIPGWGTKIWDATEHG